MKKSLEEQRDEEEGAALVPPPPSPLPQQEHQISWSPPRKDAGGDGQEDPEQKQMGDAEADEQTRATAKRTAESSSAEGRQQLVPPIC
jgi:hypothetical protein